MVKMTAEEKDYGGNDDDKGGETVQTITLTAAIDFFTTSLHGQKVTEYLQVIF